TGAVGLGPQRQVVGVAGGAELRGVVEEIVGDVLGGLPAVPLQVTGAHRPVGPDRGLQGIHGGHTHTGSLCGRPPSRAWASPWPRRCTLLPCVGLACRRRSVDVTGTIVTAQAAL